MSIFNYKYTFAESGEQQQSTKANEDISSLHYWAFNPHKNHLDVHDNLASAAEKAGQGGVTFVVCGSRAATPNFLRLMGGLASMMERENTSEARIQRAQLIARWQYSSEAKRRSWAKEEGIELNQLQLRVEEAEAAQQDFVVTSVEFAFGIGGRNVGRVHHGYWRGSYDVLSAVFNHIKGVYLEPAKVAKPTPAPSKTPDTTTPENPF